MKYKYQMHTHTSPTSKCAKMTPAELARALYEGGYAGAVITNHFYHGNTGIPREYEWADFVDPYVRDYLECVREAEKYGLDIIFGIEEGVEGYDEILLYGITPEMLYDHPELRECSAENWYKVMHSYGVLVIQAHPYRGRTGGPEPRPTALGFADGIEIYNHSHSPEYNDAAAEFAKGHPELILTSGADTHAADTVAYAGIETDERIKSGADLVRILKSGAYRLITH